MEAHGEPAVALLLQEVVDAAIPDLDRPGAVLARGDRALEVRVVERVILDVDGEMALACPKRDTFRHRPARERTVPLEPKVVVETARGVPLHDETRRCDIAVILAEGLRGLPGSALLPVLLEAHLWIVARNATRSLPTSCKMRLFPAQTALHTRG